MSLMNFGYLPLPFDFVMPYMFLMILHSRFDVCMELSCLNHIFALRPCCRKKLPEGVRLSLSGFSLASLYLHNSCWCIVWHDVETRSLPFTWFLSCPFFCDCITSIILSDLIYVSSRAVVDFTIAMPGMNICKIGLYHFTRTHACSDPIADNQVTTCLSRFGFLVF